MNCIQCNKNSLYKCPTCRQPYCSVTCCKKHKEIPCSLPPVTSDNITNNQPQKEYEFPTEDTVDQDKLKLLEHSQELHQCLNNPHLREILEKLDNSSHPDSLMQNYMQEPIFTEFVDECLKVLQPS